MTVCLKQWPLKRIYPRRSENLRFRSTYLDAHFNYQRSVASPDNAIWGDGGGTTLTLGAHSLFMNSVLGRGVRGGILIN